MEKRKEVGLMAKYINKEELIRSASEYGYTYELDTISYGVPTIDIVHCKDCKHRGTVGIDSIDCRSTPDNWFCADGERK